MNTIKRRLMEKLDSKALFDYSFELLYSGQLNGNYNSVHAILNPAWDDAMDGIVGILNMGKLNTEEARSISIEMHYNQIDELLKRIKDDNGLCMSHYAAIEIVYRDKIRRKLNSNL